MSHKRFCATPVRDNKVRYMRTRLAIRSPGVCCPTVKKERLSDHSTFFPAPSPGEQVKISVIRILIRDFAGYFSDFAFTIARIFS